MKHDDTVEVFWSEILTDKESVILDTELRVPSFTIQLNRELKRLNLSRPQLLHLLQSIT